MRSILSTLAGAALCTAFATAAPLVFSGSNNTGLAASVSFDVSGPNLVITLTNTASAAATMPAQILTGVFFNVANNVFLTPGSATVAAGSSVVSCTAANLCTSPDAGDVGGEWAYLNSLNQYGANSGISSSGLGLFGPSNRFNTLSNLQGPTDPDGLQFGIAPAGFNPALANGGVQGNALIVNSVVFTLGALPAGFSLADISNVTFQYGTALSEPSIRTNTDPPGVPEPATMAMLGSGLVGLAWLARRRKIQSASLSD